MTSNAQRHKGWFTLTCASVTNVLETILANLKTMTIAQLIALRDDVAKYLTVKKDELQDLINQLGGGEKAAPARGTKAGKGSIAKVAAKYRHPVTGETWSGRGGTVRWLAEELKAGKKKEDFLIGNAPKKSAMKKTAKKANKANAK